MTKVCSVAKGCGQEKDVSEFNVMTKRNGYSYICKECRKKYLKKNEKRIAQYHQDYARRNKEKLMFNSSRVRARNKGIEHTITLEDIKIPEYCPILGIKLESNVGTGQGGRNNSATLDRIDNSKGYTKENVRVISHRAKN